MTSITTVDTYARWIRQALSVGARKMGVQFTTADMPTRVIVRAVTGMFAVLIELLVEKGVFTDAELQAKLQASAGGEYPPEPVDPAAPAPAPVVDPPVEPTP